MELLVASKKVSIRSFCNEDLLEVVLISGSSLGSTLKQLLGLVVAMPSNQKCFQLGGISHCKTKYFIHVYYYKYKRLESVHTLSSQQKETCRQKAMSATMACNTLSMSLFYVVSENINMFTSNISLNNSPF